MTRPIPAFATLPESRPANTCCAPICLARPGCGWKSGPAAIVVPTKAVQSRGNAHFVFVKTDATGFEARALSTSASPPTE